MYNITSLERDGSTFEVAITATDARSAIRYFHECHPDKRVIKATRA